MRFSSSLSPLLAACAAAVVQPQFQGVGDPVPDAAVDAAAREVGDCLMMSCDPLGDGWSFWYAAVELADGRFVCPMASECGPRPAGCERDADCPCRCHGLTLHATMQVVLTRDLSALRHELVHVCAGIEKHGGQPEWECQ